MPSLPTLPVMTFVQVTLSGARYLVHRHVVVSPNILQVVFKG